jgi:hypothetical protein
MRAWTVGAEYDVLAHGLGGRSDLPVAPWLATYAGAVVVAVSFFVATTWWTRARLGGVGGGLDLRVVGRVADSRTARAAGQLIGLTLLATFLLVAFLGPDDGGRTNPAPTWFYVWFWVGLVPASLLLGPVWRHLNPLRGITAVLRAGLRRPPTSTLPERWGHVPAAALLLAFLWLELVHDRSASPRVVGWFVVAYCVLNVAGGVRWGPSWFERADGFEVYSTMLARAGLVGRGADGGLVLRNPLRNLAITPARPDLTPVVVVVLGSTAFDGISRQSFWSDVISGSERATYLSLGTAGLAGAIALVAATYGGAMLLTRPFVVAGRPPASALFAPTLIPIAIGYTVAHYVSFALFQGQQGYLLANDPLGRGWDLLGLAGRTIDYTLLSPTVISFVQIGAIVVGHVVAVVSAHDRSLESLDGSRGMRAQYPLLVVMIAYTSAGIVLLAGG